MGEIIGDQLANASSFHQIMMTQPGLRPVTGTPPHYVRGSATFNGMENAAPGEGPAGDRRGPSVRAGVAVPH